MGTRSLSYAYQNNHTLSDTDRHSEPEEYVLDTYALQTNSDISSSDLRSLHFHETSTESSSRIQKKPPFLSKLKTNNTNNNNNRTLFSNSLVHKSAPVALWVNNVDVEGAAKARVDKDRDRQSLISSSVPSLARGKAKEEHSSYRRESSTDAAPAQDCIGIIHNDPLVCSCCACHVLIKKGCERRNRARQPRGELVGATMGDLDGLGVGKGRTGRRRGHQPPFLKTVSIIDTLSELGPEVRQLAEEPRSNHLTKAATSSSRNPKSISASSVVESKDGNHALGPPLVSPDFQQYTEKIYDAVTRHSNSSAPSARIKNHRSRFLPSSVHSERLKKASNHVENHDENGFKVRLQHEKVLRRTKQIEQRGRERGRTPDWIKRIFDIAKKGDLLALKQGIADMEETLVRNLSDHAGNNLLHVMAVFGHLSPMAWMLTTHAILIDALQDENKFGLTPLVCTIKYGHLHLLQWLVENTVVKDKVKCKDGERSLLHIAAKYAQEEIVGWLVDYMMTHEISLDNKDHHGNTALHLATRTGNSRLCSILLQHGADVTLKNDLGQKAWEICVIRGHLACAEYLCVHESGLALATDLTRREAELEAAMADNHDLRINFKEVMSIARRMLREREEAVRELSRLHEQMVEAHDNILLLHAYPDEDFPARDRMDGDGQQISKRDNIDSVVAYVKNLHDRWQTMQKTWFGSSLVNMKHKMLLVEEAWKKLRHRSHRTVASTHHPLDVFRGKLCAVRAQGGEGRLGDLPSLCSSEESIVSLFPFTDDDETYEKDDNYEPLPSSTPARVPHNSKGKYQSAEKMAESLCARHDAKLSFNNVSAIADSSFIDSLSPRLRTDDSLSDKKDMESALNLSHLSNVKSSSRQFWADPSLSLINELSPGEQLPKEEISARLKELALTSESGSCSVLEVIEPSSEESDAHLEDERFIELSLCNPETEETMDFKPRVGQDRRGKRTSRSRKDETEINGRGEATTSSESGVDYVHSSEPSSEFASHVSPEGKHFLGNETSVGAAAVDVSDKGQRSQDYGEIHEAYVGISVPAGTSAANSASSTTTAFKRKGFLHKLIKPPHWPSKRKTKTIRKLDAGNSREFLDPPYPHRSGNRAGNYSVGDGDPHTTPESNTSSSQEYSNSSEESSIGKPTSTPTSRPTEPYQTFSGHIESEGRSVAPNNAQDIDKKSEKLSSNLIPLSSISPLPNSPPPLPLRRAILSPAHSVASLATQGYHHSDDRNISVKNINNTQKNSVTEVRSVATSEDSGIVARPASSASKSDSVSRPDSSSSTFPPFKTDYSLQKSNLSLTQDMLPTPDSSTASRMSPAPSEVSKTESALSPPSDVSKSESSRQTSMGKGSLGSSTNSSSSKDGSAGSSDYSVTILPLKKDMNVKTAAIINISCDQKGKQPLQDELTEPTSDELPSSKKERPWYELSDEESDILLPDRLTTKVIPRHSSSEDETELC